MADSVQRPKGRQRVRALLLADRINTANLEHQQVFSPVPLTYKVGEGGFATLFRYGVAVLTGLSSAQEDEVLAGLRPRLTRPVEPPEEETAFVEFDPERDDQILPGGPITLKTFTPEHLIVI